MAKSERRPFDPRNEFVARKEFRFSGVTYLPGEEFPWRRLAVDQRKLKTLYEGKFIDIPSEEETAPKKEGKKTKDKITFNPKVHSIKKLPTGKYVIKDGKKTVRRVSKKLANELKKAKKPVEIE